MCRHWAIHLSVIVVCWRSIRAVSTFCLSPFRALRQLFFRPPQTPEFFVNQPIGFLLVTLLAFRSVVAATSRLANGKQLLSELIIPQAPTAPYLPVISLRFPPPPPLLHLAHSGHQVGRASQC